MVCQNIVHEVKVIIDYPKVPTKVVLKAVFGKYSASQYNGQCFEDGEGTISETSRDGRKQSSYSLNIMHYIVHVFGNRK